jgi:HEAT repeat protein
LAAVPATEAIGFLGGPEAAAALGRLTRPGIPNILRETAVQGLGRNPSEQAAALLLDLAEGPAPGEEQEEQARFLRRIAILSLAGQGEFLTPHGSRVASLLADPDPEIRRATLQTLRSRPLAEGEGPVRAIVTDEKRGDSERVLALRVLALYDPAAATSAARAFAREGDSNLRLEAMQVLGSHLDQPGSREALLGLVADDDPSVSALALEYLRDHLGPGDVEIVARAAKSEDDGVRTAVCELLGSSGASTAVPTLVSLLDDPEPVVRQAAASGLGRLGGEDAQEALSAHRMDPDPGVRSAVRKALGKLSP